MHSQGLGSRVWRQCWEPMCYVGWPCSHDFHGFGNFGADKARCKWQIFLLSRRETGFNMFALAMGRSSLWYGNVLKLLYAIWWRTKSLRPSFDRSLRPCSNRRNHGDLLLYDSWPVALVARSMVWECSHYIRYLDSHRATRTTHRHRRDRKFWGSSNSPWTNVKSDTLFYFTTHPPWMV